MAPAWRDYRNLPNLLTAGRIVAIPVLMGLLCFPGPVASLVAAVVFVAAGATDFLDGFLARRHRAVSPLGKFLDPLADKLLITAALIMLIPLRDVPAWMVVVIVGRELAVTGLRAVAASEGLILAADRWGKLKTFLQMAAVTCLILHYPYQAVDFQRLGRGLLWVALAATVASGYSYFAGFFATSRSQAE
ncbi:MAG: CDP-diacylglycerol--glycerol-3-phosphate 3-phosphatidyltransferase [Desulfobaccales bacterium]